MPTKKFTLSDVNRAIEKLKVEGIDAPLVDHIQQLLISLLQEPLETGIEGRLKFGYRREGKVIVVDEESAITIRYIDHRRKEGATLQTIATELNTSQRNTAQRGHKWFASSVHSILQNYEAYQGKGGWPPILKK